MRRTAAATAVSLLAALAIAGPFASAGRAADANLQCATAPAPACALLDDLNAQLAPIAPLLGGPLAPLTGSALGLAGRSDQPAGVPTADVVQVSRDLLAQLTVLPEPVSAVVGATGLGAVTDTLRALVADLTAPVTGAQESEGASPATPAATSGNAAPVTANGVGSGTTSRNGDAAASPGSSSAPSGAAVPNVPVGDPLTLAPLSLPDFGFDTSFEPAAAISTAERAQEAAFAEAIDDMSPEGHMPELAVVAVLSLLLLAGAGIAQLQANRHLIPD